MDHLVSLPDSKDRATKIIEAMKSMERDYTSLRGVLPKSEQFTDVLRNVMRQVKILREQKEEVLQGRDLLLPRLLNEAVAA